MIDRKYFPSCFFSQTANSFHLLPGSQNNVPLQLLVEILKRGIGVGSPENLAAGHLNY